MICQECLIPFSSETFVFLFTVKKVRIYIYRNLIWLLFRMGVKLDVSNYGRTYTESAVQDI
jgi:hypothetical protein